MGICTREWYDLGCKFHEISKKIERIHMMLLIFLNENNYYIRLVEAVSEHFDIILRNELISLLYKEYADEDYLPGYDNLLLTDVFYNTKMDLNETVNYGRVSVVSKSDIVLLCREVIGYIDRLYPAYGSAPVHTPNRIIMNLQRVMNCLKKL